MIAGCSFSAVSQKLPGTSWSEVLAKKLGWDLVNLARQGCSNGGIRIQIDEIRRQRPDFAVITPTFWDRMEIPASAAPYEPAKNSNSNSFADLQDHLQNRSLKNGYDRNSGIDNINYRNNEYRMICETISSLAENCHHFYRKGKINKDTQTAIKHYVNFIYDSNWKKQMDEWIIVEGLMRLYLEDIKFIVFPGLLWPFDPDNQTLWRDAIPSLIPDKCVVTNELESVLRISGNNPFTGDDPGYHSNTVGQEIIAENWYQRIKRDYSY